MNIDIPPITKIWMGGIILTGIANSLNIVDAIDLIFNSKNIIKKLELWRLITCVCYFGPFSLSLFILLSTIYTIFGGLEQKQFEFRRGNLIYIFILLEFFILILSARFDSIEIGSSLIIAFCHIYGKLFTREHLGFMMIDMPVQVIPYASMIVTFLHDGNIKSSIIGLFAGHIVFYLLFILPTIIGKPILRPPKFFSKLFDKPEPNI